MKTFDEILLTHLFQSSVNAAVEVHGVFPEQWAVVLMVEEDDGIHILWDRPLYSAFIWGDSVKGQVYYERVNRYIDAQIR